MKILWVSEFKVPTGFARVSKSIVSRLNKKHDITVLDWYQLKASFDCGVKVIGKKDEKDEFGVLQLMQVCEEYDAIFILNDVWNIDKYLSAIKKGAIHSALLPKIVIYFPVDAELHNPAWYSNFDIVSHAVTYTQFAKGVVCKAAPQLRKKIKIIPHGVDTDTFYPSPTPKHKIREYLYGSKALRDKFIFFTSNRNTPRKKIDITIRAFSEFVKKNKVEDAYLHLHCGMMDYGIHIPTVIKQFGIDNRIIVTNKENMMQNIPSDMLNLYYNATDVGVNSSLGEGWGLCNIEHAATGAPQIVPNHSACAELFRGRGALVDTCGDIMLDECYTLGKLPDYKHMAECMYAYYSLSGNRSERPDGFNDGDKAYRYFTQPKFNWTVIAAQWDELFDK